MGNAGQIKDGARTPQRSRSGAQSRRDPQFVHCMEPSASTVLPYIWTTAAPHGGTPMHTAAMSMWGTKGDGQGAL